MRRTHHQSGIQRVRVADLLQGRHGVTQLAVRAGRCRQGFDLRAEPRETRRVRPGAAHASRGVREHGGDGGPEEEVVVCGNGVKGRPHEPALDQAPVVERPGERVGLEALDPRPQGDVRRGRFLGLHPADRAGRLGDVDLRPMQQVLPRKRRPVELDARQHGQGGFRGHRPRAQRGRRSQTKAIAMAPTTMAAAVVARIDRYAGRKSMASMRSRPDR